MPSRILPGLGLTGFWDLGQDGWKDANDVNLRLLSALVQGRALDHVAALPGSPADGDVYLLTAAEPTNPNKIAIRDAGAWVYVPPQTGWHVYDVALAGFRTFSGSAWAADSGGYSDEQVRDVVAALLTAGTNITLTYNDAGDTLTIDAAGGGAAYTDEQVRDVVAAMLVAGTNITLTNNDAGDTLTVDAAGGGSYRFGFFFTTPPTASEVLLLHTVTDAVTLADDFSGSVGDVGTNPTASFVLDVQKNGASVGSITISTSGAFTFATTGTTVALAAGDQVKVVAPAVADATCANVSITFKGAL